MRIELDRLRNFGPVPGGIFMRRALSHPQIIEHRSDTTAELPPTLLEHPKLKDLDPASYPKHVFIIPDGNRRFARANGQQEAIFGHMAGYRKIVHLLEIMGDLPIDTITWWAFSDNNFERPEPEKKALMELFGTALSENIGRLHQKNAKFVHLGRKDRIPQSLAETLTKAEELTKDNTGQTVCMALDYGDGVHEQTLTKQAVIFGVEQARKYPDLAAEEIATMIDKERIKSFYNGSGRITSADLLIRTGCEKRTSGPGILEGAETELYFIDKFFPDTTDEDYVDAIASYSTRERRLGK